MPNSMHSRPDWLGCSSTAAWARRISSHSAIPRSLEYVDRRLGGGEDRCGVPAGRPELPDRPRGATWSPIPAPSWAWPWIPCWRRYPTSIEWLVLDEPRTQQRIAPTRRRPSPTPTGADRCALHNAAYVIYTSGSTGRPKGVVVTQAGLANFAAEQRERYRVTAASRVLMFASPSFDASVLELLMAVGSGAALVDRAAHRLRRCRTRRPDQARRVTHAFLTPSVLASMDPSGLDDLEVVVAGGEAVPAELVTRWAGGSRGCTTATGRPRPRS